MLCQFGTYLYKYMMVRRLPNRFIGECSWYFRCLCVIYCLVNVFGHQNVKDFVHKKLKNTHLQIYLAII